MSLVIAIVLAVFVLPHPWGIVAVVVAGVIDVGESILLVRWSQRRRAVTGGEALVGKTAVAVGDIWPVGQVRVDGELWQARARGGVSAGDRVRITSIDGLTLEVEPE